MFITITLTILHLLMFILSILFLRGKLSNWLTGHNSNRYDRKRLTYGAGTILFVLGLFGTVVSLGDVLFGWTELYHRNLTIYFYGIAYPIIITLGMFYINKYSLLDITTNDDIKSTPNRDLVRLFSPLLILFVVILILLISGAF